MAEQGTHVYAAAEVKKAVNIPVVSGGRILDAAYGDQLINEGKIDMIFVARSVIADPEWPNKVAAGQIKDIHRCVRCNKKCLGGLQQHQGTHCIYEKG